jgi:hypothetical protein
MPGGKSPAGAQKFLAGLGSKLRPKEGASFMPVSARLATWVGMASAIAGGFFALRTYEADVGKQVDESVAKTFELVQRFHEGELSAARIRVNSYVDARRHCDSRMIAEDLTDNDFVVVLDFFDLVHACVEADLCDEAAATRFFAPYANFQQPILSKVVEELRAAPQSLRSDSAFGEGMKAFAADPTPAPPCRGAF